jgi:hypothetical protein
LGEQKLASSGVLMAGIKPTASVGRKTVKSASACVADQVVLAALGSRALDPSTKLTINVATTRFEETFTTKFSHTG